VNILLCDDDLERRQALGRRLLADHAVSVLKPRANQSLTEMVATLLPDVVLIDTARPDRDGLNGTRHLTPTHPRPLVPFVDEGDPAFMRDSVSAGVSCYVAPGAAAGEITRILRTAMALFRRHQQKRHPA